MVRRKRWRRAPAEQPSSGGQGLQLRGELRQRPFRFAEAQHAALANRVEKPPRGACLGSAPQIDEHIAAAHEVESLDSRGRGSGRDVVPGEPHACPQSFVNPISRLALQDDGLQVFGSELHRKLDCGRKRINAGASFVERSGIHVGRFDAALDARLFQQHRKRIGLLTLSAPCAPDAQWLATTLACELWKQRVAQIRESGRVPMEAAHLDGDSFEQPKRSSGRGSQPLQIVLTAGGAARREMIGNAPLEHGGPIAREVHTGTHAHDLEHRAEEIAIRAGARFVAGAGLNSRQAQHLAGERNPNALSGATRLAVSLEPVAIQVARASKTG